MMRIVAYICVASLVGWSSAANAIAPAPGIRDVTPNAGLVPSNVMIMGDALGVTASEISLVVDGVQAPVLFADFSCGERVPNKCSVRARLNLAAGEHTIMLPRAASGSDREFILESSGTIDNSPPTTPNPVVQEELFEEKGDILGGYIVKYVHLNSVSSQDEFGITAYAIYVVRRGERQLYDLSYVNDQEEEDYSFFVYASGEGQVEYQLTAIDLAGNESDPASFFVEMSVEGGCSAAHAAHDSGVPFALSALAVPLVLFSRRRRNAFKDGR